MADMDRKAISAQDVADYFLASVDEIHGDNITNLKLQKLLYYAQGFHLAITGRPLFDDPIQAWEYGPVVPSIYRAYRDYRAQAIPRPEDGFDDSRFSKETRDILDEVATVYGQFSAVRLMQLTHAEPPWKGTERNEVISQKAMAEYFKTQLVDG